MVCFDAFHMDGAVWACRTKGFTCPAPDAAFGIDGGNKDVAAGVLGVGYHEDGFRWAMARTVVARLPVGLGDTVLPCPNCGANLGRRFLGTVYQADGSGGADFRTTGAFRAAIVAFVAHLGLHQFDKVGGGA